MYPFERFTERAKKVLTLAQEEAERSHHSYIGTEHLLLGLLREGEGLAAKVLNNLGVEINKVRATIESVLGRNERNHRDLHVLIAPRAWSCHGEIGVYWANLHGMRT